MYYPYWRYAPAVNMPNPMDPINNYSYEAKKEKYCDYFDIGDKAPDFTLPGIVNRKPADVSLSDLRGKWVALFFYGSDFTFV